MEVLLNKITDSIIQYREMGDKLVFQDAEQLSVLLKDISANLFFLETHRDNAAREFNTVLYNEIKNGNSVSGSEIVAKQRVPELYQLRRLMTSAYKVQDAIRTNISFLKQERN
jgi:hypothetical protein